jgi:hypothetical protein
VRHRVAPRIAGASRAWGSGTCSVAKAGLRWWRWRPLLRVPACRRRLSISSWLGVQTVASAEAKLGSQSPPTSWTPRPPRVRDRHRG